MTESPFKIAASVILTYLFKVKLLIHERDGRTLWIARMGKRAIEGPATVKETEGEYDPNTGAFESVEIDLNGVRMYAEHEIPAVLDAFDEAPTEDFIDVVIKGPGGDCVRADGRHTLNIKIT